MKHPCQSCGDTVPARRAALGYTLCLTCGEERARTVRHTSVPLNKSNYIYVSPSALGLLAQLNPKRT